MLGVEIPAKIVLLVVLLRIAVTVEKFRIITMGNVIRVCVIHQQFGEDQNVMIVSEIVGNTEQEKQIVVDVIVILILQVQHAVNVTTPHCAMDMELQRIIRVLNASVTLEVTLPTTFVLYVVSLA